ncbi:hypothetical protein [Aquimarina macrocephali]|uniref:hypothetical protein n=1 Tax=Aquimarina macrocephali TaxID=666563 RepID=UPI003F66D585
MNNQEFTPEYPSSVHTDPVTQQKYIRIPITEPGELQFMQYVLSENLQLLSHLEDDYKFNGIFKDCVYWVSKILLASYPFEDHKVIRQKIIEALKLDSEEL